MKTKMHHVRRTLLLLLVFVSVRQAAHAQLHADFNASPASGCAPLYVSFHDLSTGNPGSWKWDLGNGTISYLQNPSATYFNPGKYTIRLVVKTANQTDSVAKQSYITVYALPKPSFRASDTTGCYPLRIQFTDQSAAQEGSIVKWEWDLGDGTLSSLQNPVHVYTAAGNYNVILRITNSGGCTSTLSRQQYIKISDGVKAGFSFVNSNLCKPPSIVSFTNSSTGTGTLSYQWVFGDGHTATGSNPSNTYTTAGLYTPRLVVINDKGCTDTLSQQKAVTIGQAKAAFTAPDSMCQSASVQFTNTSQPLANSYTWSFGDQTLSTDTSPSKVYNLAGKDSVQLVADFGSCKDTALKIIRIVPKPVVGFTADKTVSCQAPFTVHFTNTTPGGKAFQWSFGDGSSSALQNPAHTYQQQGSYTVTLIVTSTTGCTDSLVSTHYIVIQPVAITLQAIPFKGCLPLAYKPVYTVATVVPLVGYQWDFGDGGNSTLQNPVHVYNSQGIFTVKLTYTTADGCTGTFTYAGAVYAGQKPAAAFSALPPDACASTPIQFTDKSSNSVTSWNWQFGDGASDTSRNPAHLYNDTGYFSVQLIASSYGCSDTLQLNNVVHIKAPIARFGVGTNCATPYQYAFNNYSIGASTWSWDFGDGSTSGTSSPTHVFGATGNYTVRLTVSNGVCTHTAAYPVTIIVEKANFTASTTSVCRGDSIALQPVGFNAHNVTAYQWFYATGGDTSSSIKVAYPQSGAYTVSLVITNTSGCTDTMIKTNYLHINGPVAGFGETKNSACLNTGGTIQFKDLSTTDGTHAIRNWQWNFGDGSSQAMTAPPFAHAYTASGAYNIQLKVTDAAGCSDSISKANEIGIGDPKADFYSPDTTSCSNRPINFVDNSTGNGLSYFWRFGDGINSSDRSPVHTYPTVGGYDVELRIWDIYGCRDSVLTGNYIRIDQPKAAYQLSDSTGTCPPLVVKFTNQSAYYRQENWNFGDGTGAQLDTPTHYYNYPGTYYAQLVVTSPGGCTDTMSRKIVIKGPTGTFSYDKTIACTPGTVAFTANTQNTQSLIWDFNDGATLQTANLDVNHNFTALGIYVPKLILEDAQGCKVPIVGKDTISIYGVESAFGSNKRLLCDSGMISFADSSLSNDLVTDYEWHFGDGTVSYDQDPQHAYTATGVYPVQLIVTTFNGCRDSSLQVTNIKVAASPQVMIRGDSGACAPATLNFSGVITVADTSALSWQWQFGNGGASAQQSPLPVQYPVAGDYSVVMSTTNSSGCVTTVTKPVAVHPVPLVNAGSNAWMCEKKTALLKGTGADSYTWSPAASLSCSNCATTLAAPDSNTLYHLHGETVFGCKADDSVLISVKHPFILQVGKGDTLCKGEVFQLNAGNAELYTWTPLAGLDNSHSKSPVAHPDQTTTYQVIGYDSIGCFYDTGYATVKVYPYPTVDAGEDKTISVGSSTGLTLKVSDDVNYIQWLPATGLSCANCSSPVASPKQTTSYRVTVMNRGGCINKDDITVFVVCNGGNIFMPNTFSPNGDGNNDVFYPRGKGLYTIKSMRIFNRWGEPVYEAVNFLANDASKGWTGTYKNGPAPNDVYVYFVEVICENNALLTYSGNVALIR